MSGFRTPTVTAIVLGLLTCPALAKDKPAAQISTLDRPANREDSRINLRLLTQMLDSDVRSQRDEELGRLEDLAIDLWPGHVAHAIIASDGKYYPVPFSVFGKSGDVKAADERTLVARIDRDKLQGAKTVERGDWPNMTDRDWSKGIYSYFDERPYWETGTGSARLQGEVISNDARKEQPTAASREDRVVRVAEQMLDARVSNTSGKELGTVHDMIIDTANNRLSFVVIRFADGVRLGREKAEGKLVAVPWCKCAFIVDGSPNGRQRLTLRSAPDVLRAKLMGEEELPYVTNAQWAEQSYRHFNQDPYWLTSARATSQR